MGVKVVAVDISPRSIEITWRLAFANNVESNIHAQVAPLENLPFKENYFDCIVGTRVLHHVDIMSSAAHLSRVLKPQGFGIFWECTKKNAVLRFARKHFRRVIPLPKFGTQYKHPLTKEKIGELEMFFGGKAKIVDAPIYFFGFPDQYIFRQRVSILSRAVTILDLESLGEIQNKKIVIKNDNIKEKKYSVNIKEIKFEDFLKRLSKEFGFNYNLLERKIVQF